MTDRLLIAEQRRNGPLGWAWLEEGIKSCELGLHQACSTSRQYTETMSTASAER